LRGTWMLNRIAPLSVYATSPDTSTVMGMRMCPTNAITEDSLKTGEISRTECIVCGRCYDVCMYDALKFGVLPLRMKASA